MWCKPQACKPRRKKEIENNILNHKHLISPWVIWKKCMVLLCAISHTSDKVRLFWYRSTWIPAKIRLWVFRLVFFYQWLCRDASINYRAWEYWSSQVSFIIHRELFRKRCVINKPDLTIFQFIYTFNNVFRVHIALKARFRLIFTVCCTLIAQPKQLLTLQ